MISDISAVSNVSRISLSEERLFIVTFDVQSVPVHLGNCKNVYSGM
jgi:hypothetical protein